MTDGMERRAGGRATLAMVSAAAGVSTATVSKVLNGRPDVSAGTRARIEQLLREYDYVPVSGSRRQQTPIRVVELVFDDLISPYSSEILLGVTDTGTDAGVDVVVNRIPNRQRFPREADWAERLVAGGREGLIVVTSELTSGQLTAFERARLPLVVIDPVNLPRPDVVSVGSTNWTGGHSATQHLIELGHRRIAYLGGLASATCHQARLHGYLAALSGAQIPVDPGLISDGDFTYESGYERAADLLAQPEPPTAVFAACDAIAVGLIEAARQRDLAVPRELSVVGLDDTYLARYCNPPLTTVRQPLRDMGRLAMRTLLRMCDGEAPDSYHVELATQLIVRNSTAPPPAAT